MIDLSIIIVNWNTRELLKQCLESVYETVQGLDFEVWVVDNASVDGSVAMVLECFPGVQLIQNSTNLGFARANNQALRQIKTEYALLLNSDAALIPGSVKALMACARRHPNAGVCGAMLLNADGSFQASYGSFPGLWSEFLHLFSFRSILGDHTYPSHSWQHSRVEKEVDWVGGACFLVRRAALGVVGFLDEGYEMYGEELDWCRRMWQSGWKVIYCSQARVIHHSGQSSLHIPAKKMLRIYKSKLRYFRKYDGKFVARCLAVMIRCSCFLKAGVLLFLNLFRSSDSRRNNWRIYWDVLWAKI